MLPAPTHYSCISFLYIEERDCEVFFTYHSIKVVETLYFRWVFSKFLVKCIRDVMSWICGYEQHILPSSGQ